jgi:hypothetical protein
MRPDAADEGDYGPLVRAAWRDERECARQRGGMTARGNHDISGAGPDLRVDYRGQGTGALNNDIRRGDAADGHRCVVREVCSSNRNVCAAGGTSLRRHDRCDGQRRGGSRRRFPARARDEEKSREAESPTKTAGNEPKACGSPVRWKYEPAQQENSNDNPSRIRCASDRPDSRFPDVALTS